MLSSVTRIPKIPGWLVYRNLYIKRALMKKIYYPENLTLFCCTASNWQRENWHNVAKRNWSFFSHLECIKKQTVTTPFVCSASELCLWPALRLQMLWTDTMGNHQRRTKTTLEHTTGKFKTSVSGEYHDQFWVLPFQNIWNLPWNFCVTTKEFRRSSTEIMQNQIIPGL